jgi:arabinofuranosyltransferase
MQRWKRAWANTNIRLTHATVPLVALLVAASLFTLWGGRLSVTDRADDTYITLTYVKSLAAGEGWRYNGGEETLGTTTPLYALAVAGLARALPFVSIETLAVGLSTLAWLGTGWLIFLGRRTFGLGDHAATYVAFTVLLPWGWLLSTLGMESTCLIFGLLFSVWLAARGHAFATGAVSAALFLVRPEGLAMVPLAGAWLVWRRRNVWRALVPRFALGAALVLVPWTAYAWAHFGSALPNSALAKVGQGTWPGENLRFADRLFSRWLPTYAAKYEPVALTAPFLPAGVLSLLWPAGVLGLVYAARRAQGLLVFAAWCVAFVAGYAWLQAPGYAWYVLPVLCALQVFGALGLAWLAGARRAWLRMLGIALAAVFLAVNVYYAVIVTQGPGEEPRAVPYRALARWLRENTPPRSTVAYVEVGYLGFYTDNHVIDLLGLTEPRFVANATKLDLQSNFWLAEPDYLVYSAGFAWQFGDLVDQARFKERYQAVLTVPGVGPEPLTVYARTAPPGP